MQAKIKEGKEGGGGGGKGLQLEKLTHGFWRQYIRSEVLRAGGEGGKRTLERKNAKRAQQASLWMDGVSFVGSCGTMWVASSEPEGLDWSRLSSACACLRRPAGREKEGKGRRMRR